jgi:hypothetical protein
MAQISGIREVQASQQMLIAEVKAMKAGQEEMEADQENL